MMFVSGHPQIKALSRHCYIESRIDCLIHVVRYGDKRP